MKRKWYASVILLRVALTIYRGACKTLSLLLSFFIPLKGTSQFYEMVLCLLVVYWCFRSIWSPSRMPFSTTFLAASLLHCNCLLSRQPLWLSCLFVFVNSPFFSWVIYCMTSPDMLTLPVLLWALPFSRSSSVLKLVSRFPFVCSLRPFHCGCCCQLLFCLFWPSRPRVCLTVWYVMRHIPWNDSDFVEGKAFSDCHSFICSLWF